MNPARTSDSISAPRRPLLLAAILVAATIIVYLPATGGGFFWDDYGFVKDNWLIHAPDGLRRFWLTTEAEDYFPLTSTALWFEWRLFGDHPAGYHVVNILLHAAAAALLWRVLLRLRAPGAWLAGLLFALHPVAAASAAWITEQKNTLPMLLYLLALLAWLRYDERGGWRHYVAALGLFLLALLAKTSVVMLPVVLLLCAWWRRGRVSRRDPLRSVPFFALALALGLVTVWFQMHNVIQGQAVQPEDALSRAAAAGWIVWFYLFKLLLPAGLCAVYPRWGVSASSAVAWLPLLLLVAGFAGLWMRRKSWGRGPLFALAYFVVTLLPVLGVANMSLMRISLVADHLQYVAMAGVLALAAALLARLAESGGHTGVLAPAACAAALALLTFNRAALYGDERRFWQDNVEKQPAAWLAWNNVGDACARAGDPDEAMRCFNMSLDLNRKFAVAWHNRAYLYAQSGKTDLAIADFSEAIRLMPDYASAYNGRGYAEFRAGRYDAAEQDYRDALARMPHYADACNNLGNLKARLGRWTDAIGDYDAAIRLMPDFAAAWNNRAAARVRIGQFRPALRDCDRAIALSPNDAEFHNTRGAACDGLREYGAALRDYDRAIALKPGYADALVNRAICHYRLKEFDAAWADVAAARRAGGRLPPQFIEALRSESKRDE